MTGRAGRAGVMALAGALLVSLTGCFASPSAADASFAQKIPSALEAADLGMSDAWAERTVDGFTTALAVGMTHDADEITADQLRQTIDIVLAQNTMSADRLTLTVYAPDEDFIDLQPAASELGLDLTYSDEYGLNLPMDDVTKVIGGNGS